MPREVGGNRQGQLKPSKADAEQNLGGTLGPELASGEIDDDWRFHVPSIGPRFITSEARNCYFLGGQIITLTLIECLLRS